MQTKHTRGAGPCPACGTDWHTAERQRWLTEVQRNMDRRAEFDAKKGLTHGASATASVEDFHPDELKPGGTTDD